MRNSRHFHQEVRLNILHGEWIKAPDTTFDDMRSTALRCLGIDGLEEINSSGVIYRWSKLDRTGFALPDEVIRDIASMFATAFTPYLQCCFCTHFKRWNSYGVKHDLEDTFRKAGRLPGGFGDYYVSNGYAILGYLHYLLHVRHIPESRMHEYFRPQYGYGDQPLDLNLNMRMPSCYGNTIEYIHRGA